MRKVIKWQAWYDDGTKYVSSDGPAKNAPLDGIQAVVEYYDNGTHQVHSGYDYYYWMGSAWAGGYLNDLERWLRKELPNLKYGRFTPHENFVEILEEINRGGS